MSIVTLVSGGLDSCLVAVLCKENGIEQFPLFLDFGQLAAEMEWMACTNAFKNMELPEPTKMDISGFGSIIQSGLTSTALDTKLDAFTPGRNMLFLLAGFSYAAQTGANVVTIGLLSEEYSLFPDQRRDFLDSAQKTLSLAVGKNIQIEAPLFEFSKTDVIQLAAEKGISGTYSCHEGSLTACGVCIACKEFEN